MPDAVDKKGSDKRWLNYRLRFIACANGDRLVGGWHQFVLAGIQSSDGARFVDQPSPVKFFKSRGLTNCSRPPQLFLHSQLASEDLVEALPDKFFSSTLLLFFLLIRRRRLRRVLGRRHRSFFAEKPLLKLLCPFAHETPLDHLA